MALIFISVWIQIFLEYPAYEDAKKKKFARLKGIIGVIGMLFMVIAVFFTH